MRLQNIYARIPQATLEKLSALAEMRNQSTSELIRKIVTDFFEVVDTEIIKNSPSELKVDEPPFHYVHTESESLALPDVTVQENDFSIELDW